MIYKVLYLHLYIIYIKFMSFVDIPLGSVFHRFGLLTSHL